MVAESWRHRLVAIPRQGGTPQPLLTKLPGYPARLAPASDGGAWLALFAPRNRLIEFVLLEHDYRAAMMREIERDALDRAGARLRRQLPRAAAERRGQDHGHAQAVVAARAPTAWSSASTPALQPVASFHSRANGRRHGITSVIEAGGRVLAASQGGNAILAIDARAEASA